MIHIFDDDPRQITDAINYKLNHGSFSEVAINLNKALKKINCYAEPDQSEWVGKCDGLGTNFKYKDKKNFIIHVWEATSMPTFVLQNGNACQNRIFGLSEQITKLWHRYGRKDVSTVYGGCDTDFWHQTKEKNPNQFQFCHVNSSNVRSGLDLTIQAFSLAFANNKDVILIIKDTNPQNADSILLKQIDNHIKKYNVNIQYRSKRETSLEVRDLFSESHVTLNLLRMTSFGMPLLECSACNSICVTGDFEPTNELIKKDTGILIKPSGLIALENVISNLTKNWGLLNCYGNFEYLEQPYIYDFDIIKYAEYLSMIYYYKDSLKKLDIRTPIIKNWSWEKSAKTLVNELNKL